MKIVNKLTFIALMIFVMQFISCTPLKKQIYLQDVSGIGDTLTHITHQHNIQSGDQLYIRILGLDEKTYGMFNTNEGNSSPTTSTETSIYISSFDVNDSGLIYLPIIGGISVKGLTIDQTRNTIQSKLNKYIKNSTVIVKLVNFKITVLGEVQRPTSFINYNKTITLLEAIGRAGDLKHTANKKNVKIIRNNNHNSEIHTIDLTSRDFTSCRFYYLQPNDIVYVEPVRAKNYATNPLPITTLLSIVTTAILTLNFIVNN